jgi:hypothetical protein
LDLANDVNFLNNITNITITNMTKTRKFAGTRFFTTAGKVAANETLMGYAGPLLRGGGHAFISSRMLADVLDERPVNPVRR